MHKMVGRAHLDMDGSVTLNLEGEDGKQERISFSLIRCGVSWPIAEYPGYYCVLGLLYGAKAGEPGALLLLREGEKELLGELTEAIINEARDLRFSEIFTDRMRPEFQGMGISFIKSIRKIGNLRDLRLRHAPFAEDFHLGRDLIRKWGKDGALKIPEDSILYKSMINPAPERIPEAKGFHLYPINALRYVALSFGKVPTLRQQESDPPPFHLCWT